MLLVLVGGALWLASRSGGLGSLLRNSGASPTASTVIPPRTDFGIPQTPQTPTTLYGALFTPPPPGAPPMPTSPPHPGMLGVWSLEGGPEPFNMTWVWNPEGSVGPA
jgi:hypothetical protein